jgi:MFS transporter, DHA2 family, multidrug resistance protein
VLLGSNVNALNPATQTALDAARGRFLASGADPATATRRAYAALDGIVHQQAAIVSFVNLFRGLGLLFLVLLPLVLLMRRPRPGQAPVGAH